MRSSLRPWLAISMPDRTEARARRARPILELLDRWIASERARSSPAGSARKRRSPPWRWRTPSSSHTSSRSPSRWRRYELRTTAESGGLTDTTVAFFASCGGDVLGCNDETFSSLFADDYLDMSAGQEAFVRVAGWGATRGAFRLSLAHPADLARPANDECADAIPLVAGEAHAANLNASGTDITSCSGSDASDIWYAFVAPSEADYTFFVSQNMLSSHIVSVHPACGAADVACGVGTVRRIQHCEGAAPITLGTTVTGDNFASTPEPLGGACPSGDFALWYAFTAPEDGDYKFDTKQSVETSPGIALFDACGGAPSECSEDPFPAVWRTMKLGETVFVRVGTSATTLGAMALRVGPVRTPEPTGAGGAGGAGSSSSSATASSTGSGGASGSPPPKTTGCDCATGWRGTDDAAWGLLGAAVIFARRRRSAPS